MTDTASRQTPTPVDLENLVAEADVGGRKPRGFSARLIMGIAVAWSLFQLWYASPLPFLVGFGVFSDTEARAFHLSFALFLAFASYPAFKSSPRDRVPVVAPWLRVAEQVLQSGHVPDPITSRRTPSHTAGARRRRRGGRADVVLPDAGLRGPGAGDQGGGEGSG